MARRLTTGLHDNGENIAIRAELWSEWVCFVT